MAFLERGLNIKLWVWDLQKAHPCAEPWLLTFLLQTRCRHLHFRHLEERKKPAK